jgi:hypothetical protein
MSHRFGLVLAIVILASPLCAMGALELQISIGIRETGTTEPVGGNGGSANGIEWVNLDGQTLVLDGTFQTFSFDIANDALTAFAGGTANGVLDGTRGTLEHIRIRNSGGVTGPITLYIDDIVNGQTVVTNFEEFATDSEAVFQEPRFSGSTTGNLMDLPNASLVSDELAFSAPNANRVAFEFIDDSTTRWLRLTTFNTPQMPNPAIDFTTLTFQMAGVPIPEPGTACVLGLGAIGLLLRRSRRRA